MEWISVKTKLPEEGKVIETKINDAKGTRNQQDLIYKNRLWWLSNKSMYCYYSPTHWREK